MSLAQELFSKNVRRFRERRGYSARQLAQIIGVNASAVSHWESGRSTAMGEVFDRLCQALGVKHADFYSEQDLKLAPMKALPKREPTEAELYKLMSELLPFTVRPKKQKPKKN